MDILYKVLMALAGISVLLFFAAWTYFRWQRIAKQNKQEWHRVTFWWLLGISAVFLFGALMVFFLI